AKRVRSDDYPWAPTLEERLAHAASMETDWGIASTVQNMGPSADDAMKDWWQRRARAAASPGAVRALIEMNAHIDVRSALPSIRVPTIVVHRTQEAQLPVEGARFIAAEIPDARLVELPGIDHVPWIDAAQVLEPIEDFLAEIEAAPPPAT